MRLGLGLGLPAGGGGLSIPALDLSFINGETLDSRVTFTRASAGTRINGSGAIESISSGNPRFDYSPTSIGTLLGLLVEEQRTNLLLNSPVDGTGLSTQSVTVAATPYTLSFYGTGTVTLTGTSTAGPLVGTGAYPNRVSLTFTPTAGTLTLTVSGSVRWAQLEAGSMATSHIPTAGSQATRAADAAQMTGAAFTNWFNPLEGTFLCEFDSSSVPVGTCFVASDGTTNNRIGTFNTLSGNMLYRVTAGGAVSFSIGQGVVPGTTSKVALAYRQDNFAGTFNGLTPTTDSSGAVPTGIDRLGIGVGENGASSFRNGHIRSLRFYRTRLPDSTLQGMTA